MKGVRIFLNKEDSKKVKPFMDIFGDDYDPEANNDENINQDMLKIEQLVGFENHPFQVI